MRLFSCCSMRALGKIAVYSAIALAPFAANAQTQRNYASPPGFKLALAMEDDGEMPPPQAKPPMGPMAGMEPMDGMAPADGAMKDPPAGGCCVMSMGKPMGGPGGMADGKMGKMPGGGAPSMKQSSTVDAQAGEAQSPHLLHVGSKDFFLDQARRINLTPEQKTSLGKIKSDAMQAKANSQKQIDVAQQELWQLTSADPSDAALIDGKVQEIGKLTANQQMASIHSVEAAAALLDDQQKAAAVRPMAAGRSARMPKPAAMKGM